MSDTNVARTIMGKDNSNNILREPKFVARITHKLNNGVRRIYSKLITQKHIYRHEICGPAWFGRLTGANAGLGRQTRLLNVNQRRVPFRTVSWCALLDRSRKRRNVSSTKRGQSSWVQNVAASTWRRCSITVPSISIRSTSSCGFCCPANPMTNCQSG